MIAREFHRRCLKNPTCKMFTLSLEIPWNPLSLNKSLRSHWRKRGKLNKSWDVYIGAMLVRNKPPKPLERAQLIMVRHAHRMLDYDGLVGSLKPVVDALVTCGVLKDDSWKVTGAWVVDQQFRPKKNGPLLTIHVSER